MARTVGMPETEATGENLPQSDFSATEHPASGVSGSTAPSGSNVRPTEVTQTGIQTSGGGQTPGTGFAEVPIAPCKFGEYDLIEEIARGGMGVVYRARQTKLNRVVALKMILPGMLSSPTAIDRFYDEARAAAVLDHPNIVPIYDIGECDGQHYFTMAFIEGRSLRDLVRKETIAFGEAVRLLKGIAEGVAFAHDHKIIHRDLKPDNVLIDKQGRPRITDFGLAKRTDAATGLTVTGQILGTPTYMSPEQALGGNRQIGPPTDIYSVGGILYYALTGHPPFQGDTMTEVLCQVIAQPPNAPTFFNEAIPPELEAIVLKCLEKEPGNRYASCWELRDALTAWEQTAGSSLSTGSITVKSPSTARLGGDTAEDSLFAGLPKSFPPSTQKSAPQRKPWDYATPATNVPPVSVPEPTPVPQKPGSLELSGSRPIVLPSERNPAFVDAPAPKKNYGMVVAVMIAVFCATALVVSQWPKLFPPKTEQLAQGGETPKEPKKEVVQVEPNTNPKAGDPVKPEVSGKAALKVELKTPIDLDEVKELRVKRREFEVKVEMLGGVLDPSGIRKFKEGDFVRFAVTPERDCYVGIWSINGDGTVDQVFPHPRERDHLCKAGQRRVLPGKIEIEMSPSKGIDQAWILASSKQWNPDQAEADADLNFFMKERNIKDWLPKARNMQVRADMQLSETMIKFRVE